MSEKREQSWDVYLIRDNRNALYCGVTNDLPRRFEQHQLGKGAKALRGKGPLTLEWSTSFANKNLAMKAEYFIKRLSKKRKELLVSDDAQLCLDENQQVAYRMRINQ